MIGLAVIDNVKNAHLYYGMGAGLEKALKFIQKTDFSVLEPGKYEIDGSDIYALVQKYETKPLSEGEWEAHRNYTDIQYMVEGIEQMGYAWAGSLKVLKEYDSEKDFLLLDGSGSMIVFNSGTFAIFEPEDAHMPSITADTRMAVLKVVVKVKVKG